VRDFFRTATEVVAATAMIPEPLVDYLRIRDWRHAVLLVLFGCATLAALSALGVWVNLRPAAASMLYLTVVVLLSMAGSVTPSIILAIVASACLDYFFLPPRFSLTIDDPQDAISAVVLVFTGILIATLVQRSRRLGAAAALRDQLQLVIDTIPAVVWSNLPDGSTEFLNQRFRDYSGVVPDAGTGETWLDILHPEDRAAGEWEAAFATGEPFEKEARMRAADRSHRRFLLRFVPLRDRRGDIAKWYAASTDIEDLKRTEEVLRQREIYLREAQAELAHVNRVTTAGQLAASIAHEVAQPVAASVTNANAALRWLSAEPPQLDEVSQAVGRIVRDGRRASEILGRIRALVRKAPQRKDELDINETIGEVLALTRAELRRNRITARTQLAADLPPVLGDRVQLQQVLLNLILNAVEAMSTTDDDLRELLIATAADGTDALTIAVGDSGPGLPPETLARLFDAFFTTKTDGMGMGLSICRSIVDAHGGKVWATANEPRGAIFHFTLPVPSS
jgi:signal transduction histidine kinase